MCACNGESMNVLNYTAWKIQAQGKVSVSKASIEKLMFVSQTWDFNC